MGGRVFDVDVDVIDENSHAVIAQLNESAEANRSCDAVLSQVRQSIE